MSTRDERKKKKKRKDFIKNLIGFTLIISFIGPIIAFTPPGGHCYVYLSENPDYLFFAEDTKIWERDLMWNAASLFLWWGETMHAQKSFKKYYTRFPKLISQERLIEAKYKEIIAYYDGRQYKTTFRKLKIFLEDYGYDNSDNVWIKKAENKMNNMKLMSQSRMIDHPWF